MTGLPLIEGFMPIQVIAEGAVCLFLFSVLNFFLKKLGMGFPKFWSAVGVWVFFQWYLTYRIYPPLPFSVRALYGVVILCGIFLWVSGSQKEWEAFRRPVLNVLDGVTRYHQSIRLIIVITLPLTFGAFTFWSLVPTFDEPIELRTPVSAPPRTTVVHGQTFMIGTTPNPFRVNLEGEYDPDYTDQFLLDRKGLRLIKNLNDPQYNPWNPNAEGYMKAVREGGSIYFQNCHFCHGADLNGQGILTYAVQNPYPANIKNYSEVFNFPDSYRFWRVAQGGMGLPPEGFPWSSTMPPFKEHLEVDEIWKVVLFEFWHIGEPHFIWD